MKVTERARRRRGAGVSRSRNGAWVRGWWRGARACPSPNEGPRPAGERVSLALIHSISLPPGVYRGLAVERLFTNRLDWDDHPYFQGIRGLRVSAHFFIRRRGDTVQFVSADRRAWHAGLSTWQGREACNDFSIGIELEGLEGHAFEGAQYRQLARLLKVLARRYPLRWAVGHQHVAPGRKGDPGVGFDWLRLRRETGATLRLQMPQDVAHPE